MIDIDQLDQYQAYLPKRSTQNKIDFFLKSRFTLSKSGELFSTVKNEPPKEQVSTQQEEQKPSEEFKQHRSDSYLNLIARPIPQRASKSAFGGSIHSTQRSSVLSNGSNASSKSKRRDLIMKGILRRMRKELKEEFLELTDYQKQKRYREDEYYISCLSLYRDQMMTRLESIFKSRQLIFASEKDIQSFSQELLIFLAYLFYPKDVKRSYNFNQEMAQTASKCQ